MVRSPGYADYMEAAGENEQAMRRFVDGLGSLSPAEQVLATAALTVARKLDGAPPRDAAPLTRRLVSLVAELGVARAPATELDDLRARRAARRARFG